MKKIILGGLLTVTLLSAQCSQAMDAFVAGAYLVNTALTAGVVTWFSGKKEKPAGDRPRTLVERVEWAKARQAGEQYVPGVATAQHEAEQARAAQERAEQERERRLTRERLVEQERLKSLEDENKIRVFRALLRATVKEKRDASLSRKLLAMIKEPKSGNRRDLLVKKIEAMYIAYSEQNVLFYAGAQKLFDGGKGKGNPFSLDAFLSREKARVGDLRNVFEPVVAEAVCKAEQKYVELSELRELEVHIDELRGQGVDERRCVQLAQLFDQHQDLLVRECAAAECDAKVLIGKSLLRAQRHGAGGSCF